MKKLLALLGMVLGLAGCADTGDIEQYKGPDAGFLVGSIGFTQPELIWYVMRYRPGSAAAEFHDIAISSASMHHGRDYNNGTVQGRVVVQHLKPGRYEFYSGYVEEGDIFRPAKPFGYPFAIKPGETTYVGSFIGTRTMSQEEKTIWGGNRINGATMTVVDEHERDFTAARKSEPNLPPITVTQIPPIAEPLIFQQRIPHIVSPY